MNASSSKSPPKFCQNFNSNRTKRQIARSEVSLRAQTSQAHQQITMLHATCHDLSSLHSQQCRSASQRLRTATLSHTPSSRMRNCVASQAPAILICDQLQPPKANSKPENR